MNLPRLLCERADCSPIRFDQARASESRPEWRESELNPLLLRCALIFEVNEDSWPELYPPGAAVVVVVGGGGAVVVVLGADFAWVVAVAPEVVVVAATVVVVEVSVASVVAGS